MRVWTRVGLALAIISFLSLVGAAKSYAASDASNTIKMSPVRSDITASPGSTRQVHVTVSNLTDETVAVTPVVNDFVAGDEHGTPALILDDGQFASVRSLKRLISPALRTVTIQPGKSEVISIDIVIPENARPGGYFGAVRLAPSNVEGGGQVNLNASVASLVLLTVSGQARESLGLTDFYVKNERGIQELFYSTDNVHLSVRFDNSGDVQLGPFGKIVVMRGGSVVHETDFNNKNFRDMVLPDSARVWEVPLEGIDEIGQYTVTAYFTYGQKNQTIEVSKSFWVLPFVWIIFAIILLVLAVVSVAVILIYRRKRKRYLKTVTRKRRR